jgi:hypothetical protein
VKTHSQFEVNNNNNYYYYYYYPYEAEKTHLQNHCFSENLTALGIDPVTFDSVARNSGHQTIEATTSHVLFFLNIPPR